MNAVKQIEICLLNFFLKLGASISHVHAGKLCMLFCHLPFLLLFFLQKHLYEYNKSVK